MATEMTLRGEAVHLADGVVVTVGRGGVQLLRIATRDALEVDAQYLPALESMALGTPTDVPQALVEKLLRDGFVVPGAAHSDPVLRAALARLDEPTLAAHVVPMQGRCKEAYENDLAAHAFRKRFTFLAGQLAVCPETAWRRAMLVGDAQNQGQRRVLCLGDDDLVSVALASLGHDVTVVDVDHYLLACIAAIGESLRRPGVIRTIPLDLCAPLPPEFRGQFDVVLTDPMPNRACIELFLSRGMSALKATGCAYVAASPAVGGLVREVAAGMGCLIAAWYARFNSYYGYDLLPHAYVSDWFHLELGPTATPKYSADQHVVPEGLFAENALSRPTVYVLAIDDIETERLGASEFLSEVLAALQVEGTLRLTRRQLIRTEDSVIFHCVTELGFLQIGLDRTRRRLWLLSYPLDPLVARIAQDVLVTLLLPGMTVARVWETLPCRTVQIA